MATDDRDTPAGAAEGTRADMPAGAPAMHAEHGNPGADSGSPDRGRRQPDERSGPCRTGGGEQADEQAEDDDFEPFLPPGPNPFSSVHPQGTPPYRPAANGGYPGGPASLMQRPAAVPRTPVRAASAPGPVPGHDDLARPPCPASGSGATPGGGQPPDVPEPGQAGYAEHGYPPVSPYPPVPDDEPEARARRRRLWRCFALSRLPALRP